MALGSVERVLVLGIVVVIVAILGIAVWGATGDPPASPVLATDGGATPGPGANTPRVPQVKPQFQGTMPLPGAQPAAGVAQGAPSVLHDPPAAGAPAAKPTASAPAGQTKQIQEWIDRRDAEQAKFAAEAGGAAPASPAGGPSAPGATPAAGAAGAPVAGSPSSIGTTPGAVPGATPSTSLGPVFPLKPEAAAPGAGAAPTKPVAVEPKASTYTVSNGDSLWKIAVKQYGDSNIQEHVDAIVAANPSIDADNLKVGMKINLPPKQTSVNRLPAKEQAKLLDSGLYEVKKGDTLSSIAKKQLGDANRWREIYDLNREHIADPSMLFTGTQLRLPKS